MIFIQVTADIVFIKFAVMEPIRCVE